MGRATWLCRLAVLALASFVLGGCATFRPEDARVSSINKSAGEYAEEAILLNIVRAKRFEPLSFVTVTGLSGTSSISGSAGFAGFSLGPHLKTSPRSFLVGPDSVTRSGSNTFNVSVVDDPQSFVALLSPLSPASIAFFKNQGYPRELLFFLMVDHVRELDPKAGTVQDYENDPSNPPAFGAFTTLMSTLLRQGLVAEVDITAVPTGRSLPKSALCFDASLPKPSFALRTRDRKQLPPAAPDAVKLGAGDGLSVCGGADWVEAVAAGGGGGGSAGPPALVAAADGSAWITLNGGAKLAHVVSGKPTEYFDITPPKKETPREAPRTAFPLQHGGKTYEVYTRSVFGIYAYLGALLRANPKGSYLDDLLPPDASASGGMLNIATPPAASCFAAVSYEGVDYCVPSDANNTKRLFSLLHQLQELNTAPSNAPATLTVTSVP